MSRDIRFSFDSEEQKAEFAAYASDRGMSLSAFAKWATFTIRNKNRKGAHHPAKARGALLRPAPGGILGRVEANEF